MLKSKETQKLGLRAGINGLLAGDYLTTKGEEVKKDKAMLKELCKKKHGF